MGSASPPRPQLRVLFVSVTDDVGTDRIVAAMGALGLAVAVLSPPGAYCSLPRCVARRFQIPRNRGVWANALFARARLEAATRDWEPDRIVPLDDVAALLTGSLAADPATSPRLRETLGLSFGPPEGLALACTRLRLLDLAAELGVRTPGHSSAASPEAALAASKAWGGGAAVLKAEHTVGGTGVVVASSPEALAAAVAAHRGWRKRMRRTAKHLVWSWGGLRSDPNAAPVAQRFVQGRPAMRAVAASRGRVLAGVSFAAELTLGPTGGSSVVRWIRQPEMEEAAQRLVAGLGVSGFVSFDFVLEGVGPDACDALIAEAPAHLIEANPRPIAAGNLGRLFGEDIVGAMVAHWRGEASEPREPVLTDARLVAFFPKELERDPNSPHFAASATTLQDIPWGEPNVMAAYLRYLSSVHPGAGEEFHRRFRPPAAPRGSEAY